VRKERKRYGAGRVIEGEITAEPIIIVDDLINSGSSLEKVRVALAALNRKIDMIFVVVNFRSEPGKDWLARHQLYISSLFSLDDFGLSLSSSTAKPLKRFKNIWTHKSNHSNHYQVVPKSAPAIGDGKVLYGSDRGTLWALEVSSGSLVWQFQVAHPGRKGIWSRPVIHDGSVFFGAYDGNLYRLSLAEGREVWRQCDADWIGSSPVLSQEDGLLWIGLEYEHPSHRGSVAGFSLEDGEKVWEFPVAGYAHGTPAHSKKHTAVAIGTNDHNVYLLDSLTGDLRWKFATLGMVKEQPTFDENRNLLYVAGFDGFIRALDVHSGKQVWAIATSNSIYSTPLIVGTKLLVTSTDKSLHVIDLEMHTHKTLDLGSKSVSSPVLIGKNVFFGTNGGLIWEFDPAEDIFVGRHQLPDAVTSRLAWCPRYNLMFALTHMNQIYAFRRENDEIASYQIDS
jgi:outer membrane protein assembly factor BamB